MICYIIIGVCIMLSPVAWLVGYVLGKNAGREEALSTYDTVYQFGASAYVTISQGKKMAIVTLDSDSPLTAKEKIQLIKEVKQFLKKGKANEKKTQ